MRSISVSVGEKREVGVGDGEVFSQPEEEISTARPPAYTSTTTQKVKNMKTLEEMDVNVNLILYQITSTRSVMRPH